MDGSRKLIYLFILPALISCGQVTDSEAPAKPTTGNVNSDVIYGIDHRTDLFSITDPALLAAADSTVALINSDKLNDNGNGTSSIQGKTLGKRYNLCPTERFIEQQSSAFCSGFLVNPNTIVTAGHCVDSLFDCATTKFVFGFALKYKGILKYDVPNSEIYSCKTILHSQQPINGADFAIIKLDRAVANHAPLYLRDTGTIPVGEPVFAIGHPLGLPTKVAGGANVRTNSAPGYFVANLDTYGGNSGSAIFNARTFLVEGILVRGDKDFQTKNNCNISKACTDDKCRGEDVTKISNVLPYLAN